MHHPMYSAFRAAANMLAALALAVQPVLAREKKDDAPSGTKAATKVAPSVRSGTKAGEKTPAKASAKTSGKSKPRAPSAAPTSADVAEKRGDLKEVRGQIQTLRKEMAAAEDKRESAADQLKDAERSISNTQRELHGLAEQQNRLKSTISDIARQEHDLSEQLNDLHAQLEQLAYRQYLRGKPDALRLLLNGEDPNQLSRDLYYLGRVGQEHRRMLRETEALLARKKTLAEDMRERATELASVEARQKEQHVRLLAQREQRQEVLTRIASQIAAQRKEIGNLQRDEKELSQLVTRLSRIIAARPKPTPPPARRTPDRPAEQTGSPPGSQSTAQGQTDHRNTPDIANNAAPDASTAGAFSALKGKLRLPVRGSISNRFGGARQEGNVWKGLFIRAPAGSEVKAVAEGRVVFADWMRGFGNLLIVDHGDSFLTIYGYGDALLKQVGDTVRSGDAIAAAGSSGGNEESGLYFELRHKGQPIDPLKWVSLR